MIGQFYDLHKSIVCGTATDNQPVGFHTLAIVIVELIPVAMAFKNNGLVISLIRFRPRSQTTDPASQAHRSASIRDGSLCMHKFDNLMLSLLIQLAAICIGQP